MKKQNLKRLAAIAALTVATALTALGMQYQTQTASERLRTNAQYNRNFVAIFANAGLPVVAARFEGRAEAMEENEPRAGSAATPEEKNTL